MSRLWWGRCQCVFPFKKLEKLGKKRGQRRNWVRGQRSIRRGVGGGRTTHGCKRINIKGSAANKCDVLIYLERNIQDRPPRPCSPVCRSPGCCIPAVIWRTLGEEAVQRWTVATVAYITKTSSFLISWPSFLDVFLLRARVFLFCPVLAASPQQCVFPPLRGNWPQVSVS